MDGKNPLKVLILTADAGFGHRSAANAVAEALERMHKDEVNVSIVNPLDHKNVPPFLRDSQTDYDRWVKNVPELYKFGYQASDTPIPTLMLENTLSLLLFETIKEIFAEYEPDVVLTTYPMYQAPISLVFKTRKFHVPFFTVITDLSTVHRLWFHRKVDGCLVPNSIVAEMAANSQMPPEKITITGIPVHPEISLETRTPEQLRRKLCWDTGLTTILAVGSARTENLLEMLNVVNHYSSAVQLVVVAGKNEDLYRQLKNIDWHIPVHLYNYSNRMPLLMKASDLIICKAGGLIVTESLACGLPMILTDVIAGQETGNAELVRESEAGVVVNTPMEMLETLHHLMKDDRALLKRYAHNSCSMAKPRAAFKVGNILWEAGQAQPGTYPLVQSQDLLTAED